MRTQVHVGGKRLLIIATVCALLLTLIVSSQHSTKNDVEKVSLSLNTAVSDDSSIDLYLFDSIHYITLEDLCQLTRCTQQTDGDIISVTQGIWSVTFDIGKQQFDDGYQSAPTTILKLSENKYAVPALLFLNYFKASACIENGTLYCRMPAFTAWEALYTNASDSLTDIHTLCDDEGNKIFSSTSNDSSAEDAYLHDAYLAALRVDPYDYSSVQKYKESSQSDLYLDLHSKKGNEFLQAIRSILSDTAEPTQWYIQYYNNAVENSFVRRAYDALEIGKKTDTKHHGEKFYEAFIQKYKTKETAETYFDDTDYLLLFVSAAADAAQQMKHINTTDNLIYNVMGKENLDSLEMTTVYNKWSSIADQYRNIWKMSAPQMETKAIQLFTNKLSWETLIGADVTDASAVGESSWEYSQDFAQQLKDHFPLDESLLTEISTDKRVLYLSELQQNVHEAAVRMHQRMQGQWGDREVYAKYIQALQLYDQTSIAMYENLITMGDRFGQDQDERVHQFEAKIDRLAVSLYQLSVLQDDGYYNYLPLDITSFTVKDQTANKMQLNYVMQKETIEFPVSDGTCFYRNIIEYPSFSNTSMVGTTLNQRYADMISDCKRNDRDFEGWYQMFVEQGSNTFVLPYYEDVICQVVYNDLGAFSIKGNYLMWTGGVHPYHNVFGLNYDLITGRKLTYSDILEGTDEEIDRILRYYFEKSLGTPTDTELEILKEDTEYVLCKEGLCFYYKTGDAPPPTQIIIPYTSEDTYVISVKQLLSELYPLTYDFSSKSEQIQSFLSQSE